MMGYLIQRLGTLELLLLIGFVLGLWKSFTYLIVFILHTVSVFSTIGAYFKPFTGNHLLFFAALLMWAACLSLYLLRNKDTLLSITNKQNSQG
ncbi:hypothetical protein [Legionella antarctica]|uniref:hypothetical protein n=1 Tax=Legionella antarctica TaxID=2708020 RepID=UPI0018D65CB8|nr:hypothetical protein [Legionella antarctica]